MAGGYDGGVVLVVEGGGAEVYQTDLTVEENAPLSGGARCCVRG
jgi:hypothetical protein